MATTDQERHQDPNYDVREQVKWFARRNGATVAFVLPHLKPGMDLLDIGCGAASITLDLARAVYPGRVVGIDVNDAQLERAHTALTESGLDHVTIRKADATALEFEPASFDAVVAFSTLEYLPEPEAVIADVFDILRPGGVFGTRERELSGDVVGGRYRQDNIDEWQLVARSQQGRLDHRLGHRLKGLLVDAGFENVETGASLESWSTPEQMEEAARLRNGAMGPGTPGRQRLIDSGLVDEDDMAELDRKHERWITDPAAWYAMCRVEAIGKKPLG